MFKFMSFFATYEHNDEAGKGRLRSASLTNIPFPLRPHSIQFSTTSYTFKLETDYKFCNEVKEGVSGIRRFDWSRENIRHTGITLAFVGKPTKTLCVTVHALMTSLKVSIINFIS